MGARKKLAADKMKEARKSISFAKLKDCPTSPRKMRLVADVIRGEKVIDALNKLKFMPQHATGSVEKLLLSAVSNWEQKNESNVAKREDLFVKEIFVDISRTLKRLRPAPQGRAHKIRKRSNHVTIIIDVQNN